jgi:hypothetical protein
MKFHAQKALGGKTTLTSSFQSKERSHSFFNDTDSFFSPKNPSAFIQPKLSINKPNDAYEQEADRIANAVFNNPIASSLSIQQKPISQIQRKCKECEEEDNKIQRKGDASASTASPQLSSKIESSSGKGSVLPARTLAAMNNSFGADFSGVHIHNDSSSAQMNKEINAQAFTHGSDIYFNAGKYSPETKSGKELLAHELTHVVQQRSEGNLISRKIAVPFAKSKPLNSINPQADSQGKIVENYLNKLCIEGGTTVTGNVVVPPVDLCDLPGPLDGNMALTKAEQSKTKVGCTCICDISKSNHLVRIIIDDDVAGTTLADGIDAEKPGVGTGSTVTVPSPDAPKTVLPTKSGKQVATDPVVVLGHELCGHAFFNMRGEAGKDHNAQRGRGGHQATVERENLIRDEQGVEKRALFREPFCGEAEGSSSLKECEIWREEYNKLNGTNFQIKDTIPENPFEEKPADFRIDVSFNIDMPFPGGTSSGSFNASVTEQGKEMFGFALAVFQDHPTKSFQLEAHASSDKPAGDPDYNTRLSERRMRLILSELTRRGVDSNRLGDKRDSGCDSIDTGMKNCSDTEAGAPGTAADRKVVIRIF